MSPTHRKQLVVLGARHDAAWRAPAEVASQWREAGDVDPRLLEARVRGSWWSVLRAERVTLLVTREYEHLVVGLGAASPRMTYMSIPHPSGLVRDAARGVVHVASTRNPNQVWDFMPVAALASRANGRSQAIANRPLLPVRTRFFPGRLYLHDLAMVGNVLHANAVGQNAIVRLRDDGGYERVWWPRCIERRGGPVFAQNHLQLNSIAAGRDLEHSYFSASTDVVGRRRPGHAHFAVDRRGVVFSGASREVVARGLTRPHSARLWRGQLWVDNSGYGEVGVVEGGRFRPVVRLPGWTRGLSFHGRIAFVGTSRVLPRFRHYAPGLDADASLCGVHAVDARSGTVLGSITWPYGNQIFAVEVVPSRFTSGFPFRAGAPGAAAHQTRLFSGFVTAAAEGRTHER